MLSVGREEGCGGRVRWLTGAGGASGCERESGLSVCSEREGVCAGSSQTRRRKSLLRKKGKGMCVVVSAQTD